MGLAILPAFDYPQEVRALFSEYTDMLIENDPSFAKYLTLQNYDEEIAHLEKKYGPPWGGCIWPAGRGRPQAALACGGWTAKTAR